LGAAHLGLCRCCAEQGEYQEAAEAASKAAQCLSEPEAAARACLIGANAHLELDQLDEADACIASALARCDEWDIKSDADTLAARVDSRRRALVAERERLAREEREKREREEEARREAEAAAKKEEYRLEKLREAETARDELLAKIERIDAELADVNESLAPIMKAGNKAANERNGLVTKKKKLEAEYEDRREQIEDAYEDRLKEIERMYRSDRPPSYLKTQNPQEYRVLLAIAKQKRDDRVIAARDRRDDLVRDLDNDYLPAIARLKGNIDSLNRQIKTLERQAKPHLRKKDDLEDERFKLSRQVKAWNLRIKRYSQ